MASWLPWLGLAGAFSPVLWEISEHLRFYPWNWILLLPAALMLWAWRTEPAPPSPRQPTGRGIGAALLGAGCALQLLGIVTNSWGLGRWGLPLALLGLARLRRAPSWRVAALAFFATPPPYFAMAAGSPGLESTLALPAAALAQLAGLPVELLGPSLTAPDAKIDLIARDGGWVLAQVLAGVAWFAGLKSGVAGSHLARNAALAASLALPAQVAALCLAVLALGTGQAELGRWWLAYASWACWITAALIWALRTPRRQPGPAL